MVSEWVHAGEFEKSIMSLTGHKAVATLHRYGHTSAEAQRASQERVALWRARQLSSTRRSCASTTRRGQRGDD
jgi:hypothetical protein